MPANRRRYIPTVLKLLLILVIIAAFAVYWNIGTLPERADAQQTLVFGPDRLAPDSEAGLRVMVQEVGSGQPISEAAVRVVLKPNEGGRPGRYSRADRRQRQLPLVFQVPAELAEGDYQLVVETSHGPAKTR